MIKSVFEAGFVMLGLHRSVLFVICCSTFFHVYLLEIHEISNKFKHADPTRVIAFHTNLSFQL